MLSSEVLPAPFGPMIEAMRPRSTATETSSTARTPPNRFDTPLTVRMTSSAADCAMLSRLPPITRRHMQHRYGRYDADASKRMQPLPWYDGTAERLELPRLPAPTPR